VSLACQGVVGKFFRLAQAPLKWHGARQATAYVRPRGYDQKYYVTVASIVAFFHVACHWL